MQITKFFIFALFLPARIYQAEIVIPTSSPDKSTSILVEGLVKIVTSCYKDQINAVGLVGRLPDTLSRTLSVQHLIPTILMDDTSHMIHATTVEVVPGEFRYKLQVFIVGASSYEEFNIIEELLIKTSIWWNHMASFFILDQSQGCVNGYNFLWTAWQLNLLNAKVMCYHHTYGGFIFNYNPFTNQAPVSWQYFTVIRGMSQHPFTLFNRKYQGNEAICADLDFVKTKDLGGHEISVEGNTRGFTAYQYLDQQKSANLIRAILERKRLLQIVFRALNATPKFSGLNRDIIPHYIEMNIRYGMVTHKVGLSVTYPYQQIGVVLISKFRGHKSQLEKILCVVDRNSRIGMGIVYLVTLIFFKFFVRQAFGPALLNLVRITCNTGFTNLPDNTTTRLYLTGLLFFVVTMQGIYQGNLASLLTNAIPVRNVNSFEDIVNFGYKVYGGEIFYDIVEHADLKNRFTTTIDAHECVTDVLHDSSAACIYFMESGIFDMARRYDLHLSRDFVTQVPAGFLIRPSWYLEEQMNIILGRIMEADIFETWSIKCNPSKLDDFQFDKQVRNNKDFKIIELSELAFAFVILGIGLLCASVTFIFEVAMYRYQQRNNNTVIVLNARYDRDSCARGSFTCADRTSTNACASVTLPSPNNQNTNEFAS